MIKYRYSIDELCEYHGIIQSIRGSLCRVISRSNNMERYNVVILEGKMIGEIRRGLAPYMLKDVLGSAQPSWEV